MGTYVNGIKPLGTIKHFEMDLVMKWKDKTGKTQKHIDTLTFEAHWNKDYREWELKVPLMDTKFSMLSAEELRAITLTIDELNDGVGKT